MSQEQLLHGSFNFVFTFKERLMALSLTRIWSLDPCIWDKEVMGSWVKSRISDSNPNKSWGSDSKRMSTGVEKLEHWEALNAIIFGSVNTGKGKVRRTGEKGGRGKRVSRKEDRERDNERRRRLFCFGKQKSLLYLFFYLKGNPFFFCPQVIFFEGISLVLSKPQA